MQWLWVGERRHEYRFERARSSGSKNGGLKWFFGARASARFNAYLQGDIDAV
jgi:hypothetical protein